MIGIKPVPAQATYTRSMAKLCEGFRMIERDRVERSAWEVASPPPGEVILEVAGCGVCHTDLGFLHGESPTRKPPPIVLGHEISGVVVEAGPGAEDLLGARVIAPAVAPCGACSFCLAGRPTSCRSGIMPGNDRDGGFATHVLLPARGLCQVPHTAPLEELSVVADAVTTPLQAIRRAGLQEGEVAIFVGAGGVGGFGVQIAAALGATVIAIDVDPRKLARAADAGAAATLDGRSPAKELRASVREVTRRLGTPDSGWRVFETSGTPAGQETAFSLLSHGGSLSIVGFTPESVRVRLSSVMALDASIHGNWGADPALYPEAVALCTSGRVRLDGFVRTFALDDAPAVLHAAAHGEIAERPILVSGRSA